MSCEMGILQGQKSRKTYDSRCVNAFEKGAPPTPEASEELRRPQVGRGKHRCPLPPPLLAVALAPLLWRSPLLSCALRYCASGEARTPTVERDCLRQPEPLLASPASLSKSHTSMAGWRHLADAGCRPSPLNAPGPEFPCSLVFACSLVGVPREGVRHDLPSEHVETSEHVKRSDAPRAGLNAFFPDDARSILHARSAVRARHPRDGGRRASTLKRASTVERACAVKRPSPCRRLSGKDSAPEKTWK